MAQFAHANVCRMIGIVRQDDPIMLVLELLPNGSLYNWLRAFKNLDERPDNTVFIRIALDVAKGMKYLSDLSFIHRGWVIIMFVILRHLTTPQILQLATA